MPGGTDLAKSCQHLLEDVVMHGGTGIVGDDVAVAIYGNLILQGVFHFVPDFR